MEVPSPIVQRASESEVESHSSGRWSPFFAAIAANGALAVFVFLFTEEDRYSAFVRSFAFWFALPTAIGSLILALVAAWRLRQTLAIVGIVYHGVALLVLLVWTFFWGFAGLWAQSEKGYLVGLTLQIALALLATLIAQAAVYIAALVRNYNRDRAPVEHS